MQSRKPIVVLTDLTPESDVAMEFAGNLGRMLGTKVYVVYAMRLVGRPLRAVVPVLNNINNALQSMVDAVDEQMRRTLPVNADVAAPFIDLDDPERALTRYALQLKPMVVVTSTLGAVIPSCPVLVIREPRLTSHDRVAVITTIDAFNSETIEAAGRWAFWVEQAHDCRGALGGPRFVVGLLDQHGSEDHVSKAIDDQHNDLIVVDRAIFENQEFAWRRDALMSLLAARRHTPIAFLNAA